MDQKSKCFFLTLNCLHIVFRLHIVFTFLYYYISYIPFTSLPISPPYVHLLIVHLLIVPPLSSPHFGFKYRVPCQHWTRFDAILLSIPILNRSVEIVLEILTFKFMFVRSVPVSLTVTSWFSTTNDPFICIFPFIETWYQENFPKDCPWNLIPLFLVRSSQTGSQFFKMSLVGNEKRKWKF